VDAWEGLSTSSSPEPLDETGARSGASAALQVWATRLPGTGLGCIFRGALSLQMLGPWKNASRPFAFGRAERSSSSGRPGRSVPVNYGKSRTIFG